MIHNSKFGQLLTHHKISGIYIPEEQLTINEAIYLFQGHIFFHVYIKGKPHKYWIKMYDFVRPNVATSATKDYVLWHILPTPNTTRCSMLLTGCVI
jgi:hypothetical protein